MAVPLDIALPVAPLLPAELDTPCLVIDLAIVEANAARMAQLMRDRGVELRPHVKTHKSVALARVQLDAGAVGVTVGTLGEAEVMAAGGISDIFLAYPLWLDGPKAARLRALLDRPGLALSVGVDTPEGAERLAAGIGQAATRPRVLVEVDARYGRTGVAAHEAGHVAAAAARAGLEVIGAFTHGGHGYAGPDARQTAAADELEALGVAAEALRAVGIEPRVLSAGSSPTALGVAAAPATEVRPGTYLLGDRQQVALGSSPPDGVAVAVAATVVSDAVEGQVVINAGAKALTKDVPPYVAGHGFLPGYRDAVIERVSDYHGQVRFAAGSPRPRVGEVVAVVPNHACPVVDLYDSFVATRGGKLVGLWPVDARGRSR